MSTPISVRLSDSNQTLTLPIEDTDLADDARLQTAIITLLSAFYPDIQHAHIQRETRDGTTTVVVTKRAGTKGGARTICAALAALPAALNPAQTLAWELVEANLHGTLTLDTLMGYQTAIEQALIAGQDAIAMSKHSLRALRAQPTHPADFLIPGV